MKVYCTSHGGAVTVDRSDCGSQVGCDTCGEILSVPDSPLGPGVVLDDFVLGETIATTDDSIAIRAHQMSLDREVVLKVLPPTVAEDDAALSAILKEARLSASLGHPHALKTYAISQDDGYYFVATEFVDGPSLTGWMAEHRELEPEWCIARLQQVAQVLDAAWDNPGMLHGNLHADDILIRRSDQSVRVANMGRGHVPPGLATDTEAPPDAVYYTAPEVLRGEAATPQSDIYSLGAIAYRMLTGLVPADGSSAAEVARGHLEGIVEPVIGYREGLPDSLNDLIMSMLALAPADRPEDHRSVLDALRNAALDVAAMPEPAKPVPTTTTGSIRRRPKGATRSTRSSSTLARAATVAQMKQLDLVDKRPKGLSKPVKIGIAVIVGFAMVIFVLAAIVIARETDVRTDPTSRVRRSSTPTTATTTTPTTPASTTFSEETTFSPLPGPLAGLADGEPLRIMVMGDWTVVGDAVNPGMAAALRDKLKSEDVAHQFVGSLETSGKSSDRIRHEGYMGWSIQQVLRGHFWDSESGKALADRVQQAKPHVVLLHVGSHDLMERQSDADWTGAAARCMELVRAIQAAQPECYVIVGTLISPPDPAAQVLVDHFNQQLSILARADILAGSRLALVNMHRVVQRNWSYRTLAYPANDERIRMATTWHRAIQLFPKLRPPDVSVAPVATIAQALDADGSAVPGIIDGAGIADGLLDQAAVTPATSWRATARTSSNVNLNDDIAYLPKSAPTLQLDLEAATDLTELTIWTLPNNADGRPIGQPRIVQFETSTDGHAWDDRGLQILLPAPHTTSNPGHRIDVKWLAVRHLRIRVLSLWERVDYDTSAAHDHATGLAEVQVRGTPSRY